MQSDIERGTVVADYDDQLLVVWEALRDGAHLAMPLHRQTGPLHRAHVLLQPDVAESLLGPRAPKRSQMIIDTRERRVVDASAQVVGWVGLSLVTMIEITYQRARTASRSEIKHYSLHAV